MNGRLIGIAAFLIVGAAGISAAATPAPAEPPMGTLRPFTMPAVERVKLPNGLTVALVPFGSVPQATVSLDVFAGDIDSGGKPWLAATTAELLKQGAGGRDAKQLAEEISSMGGNLTTTGDANITELRATVLSERAGDAIALIADVARRPTLAAADFERVKADRKRNLAQAFANPQTMLDALTASALFGRHPYGAPLPTAAQLDAMSLDDVRAFHAGQFGARRATLYVIGQFDAAAVKAAAERALGDWAPGPARLRLPASIASGPRLILADRPGSEQTSVRIAFEAPAAGTTDDIPMRVADALLGGSFGSRITANIREDKGYTYSPGSFIAPQPGIAVWAWDGDITPNVTGAAMAEVFKEIRRLQNEPPPLVEAGGMKTYAATYLLMRTTSADLLLRQLVRADTLGLPADYFPSYVQRAMAVTPQQMSALATRHIPLDRLTMVVVGDMKVVEPQLLALPELKGVPIERVALPKP